MDEASEAAITVCSLRKTYGEATVVDGIDFVVRLGEVFALLGPNGAGKTTTVEILEGFRRRDAGKVSVLGVDPQRPTRAWSYRDSQGSSATDSGEGQSRQPTPRRAWVLAKSAFASHACPALPLRSPSPSPAA